MSQDYEERKLRKTLSVLQTVKTEYQLTLENKLNLLKEVVEKNFPNKSFALECALSVRAQLEIKGLTQPFSLFLIAPPSSMKTTVLEIVKATEKYHNSDKFTPRSFVSHAANTTHEKLKQVDLLPKIRHKVLITPELSSLFSGDKYEVEANFRMLTRILDGKGFSSDSGVHGTRGYEGDYSFMWLGAIVKIEKKIWNLFGNLGPRIFFLRLPVEKLSPKEKIKQLVKELGDNPYNEKLEECRCAMSSFWEIVENQTKQFDGKIVWNKNQDSEYAKYIIAEMAVLLSKLRGTIPTENTESTGGSNYSFGEPIIEDPRRINSAFYGLARGHAVICGRNYITEEDLKVVVSIGMSSAHERRIELFREILKDEGMMSRQNGKSRPTTLKEMQEFKLLEIVDEVELKGTTKPFKAISLKEEFSWFLSDEFRELDCVHTSDFS